MRLHLCSLAILASFMHGQPAPLIVRTAEPVESVLEQAKVAAGGKLWDDVLEIDGQGEKASFGLTGTFSEKEQLQTGLFERKAIYSVFSNAEGRDEEGRWRLDNSGQIHSLDSDEAKTVAVSESYISSQGYFFPKRFPADFQHCTLPERPLQTCVLATPRNGRALAVWIEKDSHLVKDIEMELSVGSETYQYGAYRRFAGLLLPFAITVNHGDEAESGVAEISQYRITTAGSISELVRPQLKLSEKSSETVETTTRGYLDSDSGFLIVDASVNGQGPYPFILDTGGHDILTPEMAKRLGLPTTGKGFSTGAGAGTTATEFTTVSLLSIGGAVMEKQPFTILHIDFGMVAGPRGKRVPIAGILGLEVFERFAITIDYKGQRVTLRPAEHFQYRGSGIAVSLRFTSDMPLCNASVDGHPGIFGIDTGNNTDVIIFHPWAVRNGFTPSQSMNAMVGSSVGGALQFANAHIENLKFGTLDIGALDALLSSDTSGSLSARAEAGNLGNSVLARFIVTFEYHSGMMYLESTAK